ncbi:CAP domain-containing protein [Pseudoflavitalea sp. G-6-1-2]|nr:CAP domain-containing protein [Pseudoflavitalea sp. G-6-1-2]
MNKHRKAKGLAALQTHPAITEEARRHSMAMATNRIAFGHGGFNIRSKIVTSKIPGTNAVAENVAYGSTSAKEVVDGWIASTGHRKNIEGNYKYTGIGVARDKKGDLFFTQIFAK